MTRAKPDRGEEVMPQTASDWVVTLSSGDMSDADMAAFELWLKDAGNRASFDDMEKSWAAIGLIPSLQGSVSMDDLDEFRVDASPKVVPLRRRWGAWGVAIAAVVALAVVTVLMLPPFKPDVSTYSTGTGELKTVQLADGSLISLGARSELRVSYSEKKRQIALLSGEAFFDVMKNSEAPFVVQTGDTYVHVLGTSFDVKSAGGVVRVSVAEGRVAVAKAALLPSQGYTTLDAGQRLKLVGGKEGTVEAISRHLPGAWRSGRLTYEDTPLGEILSDARRYYPGEISLATDDLADMRVTASFQSSRIPEMLKRLEDTLPVRLQKTEEGNIVIRKAMANE